MTATARRSSRTGSQRPEAPAEQRPHPRGWRGQVGRFAVIGGASTVLHLGLLALLTAPLGLQLANVVGLLLSTAANTATNRAWTFQVRGREGRARQQLQALVVFAITWAASSSALAVLPVVRPHATTAATVAVVGAANAVSTVVRFLAMRSWIFRAAGAHP